VSEPTTWLQRTFAAYHKLERELADRFVGILGMAAWVTPKEELELMRLYAEYHLARKQPLLAALTTVEAVETPYGDAELRFRGVIGTARSREQCFGGTMRIERHQQMTRLGALLPAVRLQVEDTLRQAERTIAEALTKDRP
jgi:hypothetical protein